MRLLDRALARISISLVIGLAFNARAQTFYWNPVAPSLNGGTEAQRACNWTSDPAGGGSYPRSGFDDDFTDNALGSAWTIVDKDGFTDSPNPFVSLTAKPGKLVLRGRGADVWHDTNQFVGVYRSDITGDFDVSVKVDSQSNSNTWAKAGIMMRNNFAGADSGGFAIIAVTPGRGVTFQYDIAGAIGELDAWVDNGTINLPCWLRLARRGASVTAYYKTSAGAVWTQMGTAQTILNAAANSKIALFSTSHNANTASTAVFDDFTGGGDIAAAGIDLNFGGGTGTQSGADARLSGPLSAKSVTFTGAKVAFDFLAATLTVTDSANFAAAKSIAAGTGALAFVGNGAQKLVPRANDTLPSISKSGGGALAIAASSATAGRLTLTAGSLNCGGRNQSFSGLAATGGSIIGLDAQDTLAFTGDANFSGLTALPTSGTIVLKAISSALAVTPGEASFNDLILWPRPVSANARIAINAGELKVLGNLVFVDEKAAAGSVSEIDFRTGNPNVALDGSALSAPAGVPAGVNSLRLFLGKGTWAIKGDINLALPAGLAADSATLDFKADYPAIQNIATGTVSLGNLRHSGTGALNLALAGQTLQAASFSQSSGVLNLNGSNLEVTGDLSVSNGTSGSIVGLGGRELKAGGNISFSGTTAARLGLFPGTAWKATAGGSLIADWAEIGASDASASAAAGSASANCVNGGNNVNWNFQTSPPSFVLQPASREVMAGRPVVFKARASGSGNIVYAWRKQGDTTVLSTTDSLYFPAVDASQNGARYYCTATNNLGSVPSLDAVLTVDIPPVIDVQPADSAVVVGSRVSFTVAAHGSAPLRYAWRRTGDPAILWAGGPTFSLDTTIASQDGYSYYCTVANAYDSVVTRAAVLRLRFPPRITAQPVNVTGTAGQRATLSLTATGSDTLRYAWTRVGDTAVLSRARTLDLGPLDLGDSGSFACRVSNAYGSVSSQPAKLTVVQAATIVREPADVTTGPLRKAVFTAGVEGAKPLVYAWRRKGDTTVIGKDTILTLDSVKLADNGKIFVFTVKNDYGADTSREVRLFVVACDSVFKVAPETLAVDEGQPVTLRGTATCSSARNWTVVSGPAPRILDTESDSIAFIAPRVAAESLIVFRFEAQYANGWVSKKAVVKVRDAVPDPKFSLPPAGNWSSVKPYVVRPSLLNAAALQAAPYRPAMRYQWYLSTPLADTAQAGDSLTLTRPIQRGNLDITLCMDNGGASSCLIHSVQIDPAAVGLALRLARFGVVALDGRTLAWNADASIRVWDYRGRILWQGIGRAGGSATLPEGAARDLFRGRARLEIRR